jgi:hypothetical protein
MNFKKQEHKRYSLYLTKVNIETLIDLNFFHGLFLKNRSVALDCVLSAIHDNIHIEQAIKDIIESIQFKEKYLND